jgi:hypothetical protein
MTVPGANLAEPGLEGAHHEQVPPVAGSKPHSTARSLRPPQRRASPAAGEVLVNEIVPAGSKSEWVDLYNTTDSPRDHRSPLPEDFHTPNA